MRILLVSSYLPFPLYDGGRVRLYNIMKELAKHHKITLVCEKRTYQTKKDIDEVKKFCEEIYYVDRRKPWSYQNILRAGISSDPFLITTHIIPELKHILVKLLTEKHFDVIHVETFYIFQNLPKTYLPAVLVEHNIEYEVYQKYVATAPVVARPLLFIDIWKMKRVEKQFWQKAKELVAVSPADQQKMLPLKATVVPNGVDTKKFPFGKTVKHNEIRILFMGNFKWIQNQTTTEWIIKDIWPSILDMLGKKEKLMLWIVGKHIPENLKILGDKTIFFDENAPDDTAKIYQKADVLLSPIKVGGGTSYKILESMSSGLPVVTTELGVKGLGAMKNKHALVAEDSVTLAKHVVTFLTNEKLRKNITQNARKLIEENYTWDTITKKLENVYDKAVV